MLEHFKENLKSKLNVNKNHKILLAISGGADSIVMLNLFAKLDFNCGIAHCNFHLRGDDSNHDEKLVKELAFFYDFPFYKVDFQTKEYANSNGISIEMAARELRYDWFEKIRNKHDYQYIAVAHHQDDIIETFFINLTRGTGIRGLSGIKEKNGFIIRPLLFANREEILKYINQNRLKYREDKSNADTDIIRNRFRHEIIPLLKEISPAAGSKILASIKNLRSAEEIMMQKLSEVKKELGVNVTLPVKLNIEQLKKLSPLNDYLYEILTVYGFNLFQVLDIVNSLDSESGITFKSETHLLVKDRTDLLITEHLKSFNPVIIVKDCKEIKLGDSKGDLSIKVVENDTNFSIPRTSNFATIDFDKLNFPLKLRAWEYGDFFYPLGMRKKKKLSDFFVDQKLSIIDKQETILLVSDDKIVWIVGQRLDDRFKVTDKTKKVLVMEWKKSN